ncbi:unnamed protein product [Rangifer tarandus platyrhynchus]|uniref:Uncharacterized protein n=1 Tax=Rangifer tarandus platyrhynchus TaxID=3082113 RepID=A0AC59YBK9_RANTA
MQGGTERNVGLRGQGFKQEGGGAGKTSGSDSPAGARAPAPPASPVPGADQTNNASPAALLPLPADRLASSHFDRSRSEPRISAGAERTRATSGAT